MTWKIRHEGSPEVKAQTLPQIVEALRDGLWEPTDEVQGPGETAWTAIENHPQLAEVAEELEPPPKVREDEARLDMNALIDVCLVLLIFFMMTTTYAMEVLKSVELPKLTEEQAQKKVGKVSIEQVQKNMVRIDAKLDGQGKPVIHVQGIKADVVNSDGTLDVSSLHSQLLKHTGGTPRREEALLDAKGVSWGMVVAIQDAARAAGVRTIHYPAETKASVGGGK